jgi:CelD/BcsL family acetyltransferase involved in cellulose biosynthesis
VRAVAWDAIDPLAWEDLVHACPDATWFHTREWTRLLVRSFPRWEALALVADDAEGRLRGLLPFIRVRSLGLATSLSMPYGTPGGPIVREEREEGGIAAALCLAFLREAGRWNSRGAQMTDFENRALAALDPRARGGFSTEPSAVQVLSLAGGPDAVRTARFAPQRRRQARCARRRGLVVTEAERPAEVLEFADLYEEISRGWHSRCRMPRVFFERLAEGLTPRVLLLLARYDGRLVAGNLAFLQGGSAISWCGVMRRDRGDLHPAVVLHEEAIARACAAGCRFYDFGPSPGLPRVDRFKREFGTEPRTMRRWTALAPLGRILEHVRPALLRPVSSEEGV